MIYDSFPEAFFPIPIELNREYCMRLEIGERNASQSSVCICGLMRNSGTNFQYTKKRIEKIGSFFNSYKVFMYENDSSDKSAELLEKWSEDNDNVFHISEKLQNIKHEQNHSLDRRIDMAYYRNKYLGFLQGTKFDYVIVLDTDLIGGYSYEGILNSLSFDFNVMASNSILMRYHNESNFVEQLYYDAWAFRKIGQETKHKDEEVNILKLPKGGYPFNVNSAFGGLAIYKGDLLTSGKFKYTNADCDHVTIHKQMRQAGHSIQLNPSQITLYSPSVYAQATLDVT